MVVSAAYSGGGGNMVHLKHQGGFETYYLHLSAFGPGIRAGAHVAQGQLIGAWEPPAPRPDRISTTASSAAARS